MRFSPIRVLFPALLLPAIVFADSWAPPTAAVFASENGKYLLHVAPKAMDSFPELPEDKEGKVLGLNEDCWGSLFVKEERKYMGSGFSNNTFRPVWQQKLVNEIAPMSVYISDDGKFVVTTDDYGRLGDGENVVVIYDSEGKMIKRYPLTAFLSADQIELVPQSVSSINWAGTHKINAKEEILLLQVWKSEDPFNGTPPVFQTIKIRLTDGRILNHPKD